MPRFAPLPILALASAAAAQSNIDPAHKHTWQENTGWINWRNAGSPAATQGVRILPTCLAGFAWGENIGWINFGDGSPAGGSAYSNASGVDHGVNLLAGGDLGGLAWGENTGWINFSTPALGAQRARLESGRLRGWAWAENLGWLNLDDTANYVALQSAACYANCDASTIAPILNVNDFTCFLNRYAALDPAANCDASTIAPILNINDFTCFLNHYAAGCP